MSHAAQEKLKATDSSVRCHNVSLLLQKGEVRALGEDVDVIHLATGLQKRKAQSSEHSGDTRDAVEHGLCLKWQLLANGAAGETLNLQELFLVIVR